ncbi:MAG: DUF1552 domain-containing protein [Chitinophagaceae bacterium]|nr:DUF1552 domain-containing protein [Oligoflexus sp.]
MSKKDKSPDLTLDQRTAVNRRKLLSGMGAMTVGLTSGIWKVSTAFGADAKVPAAKRFIGIFTPNGTSPENLWPTTTAAEAPLTATPILKPLDKYLSKMLLLKGVDYLSTVENNLGDWKDGTSEAATFDIKPGGPHMKGPAAFLTGGSLLHGDFGGSGGPAGWGDRMSLDQLFAQRIGSKSRFPSLEIGVQIGGQEPLTTISYADANKPNRPETNPWNLYKRIFADANLSATDLAKIVSERKSVLDFLGNEITTLKTRLSAEDKISLDSHLTGIRALEAQITGSNAAQCKIPTLTPRTDAFNENTAGKFPELGRMQTDLMILAHSCGLTQVSTFMWDNADGWHFYDRLGLSNPDLNHHEISHLPADANRTLASLVGDLVKINSFYSEQMAYLMGQLAAIPEADGSNMLDSTLMIWGNELGAGNTHTLHNIPFILAGGAGGALKMGRYLNYKGLPHNNLLVSLANAMGLSDIKTSGIRGVCTGPLGNFTV